MSAFAPAAPLLNGLTIRQQRVMEWLQTMSTAARFANASNRAVMASPPTITTSLAADAALTNIYTVTATTQDVFQYFGGVREPFFTNYTRMRSHTVSAAAAYGVSRVEFLVDAAVFECSIYAPATATHNFRLIVDGQYASLTPITPAGTNVQSFIKADFSAVGGRRVRRIGIEWQSNAGFRHAAVGPTSSVQRRQGNTLRAFVQGDSFVAAGTNNAGHFGIGGIASKCLGIDDIWVGGVGGTGWLNQGSGQTTFRERNADVLAATPNIVIAAGGYNDRTLTAGNNLLRDEVATWLRQTRASLPHTVFFLPGCWPGSLGPSADAIYAENQIAAGVAAVGDTATFFIPVCTDVNGSWVTGTGRTDAPTGTGNADLYQGRAGDVTHPSDAGYVYYGERLADAIMRVADAVLAG